MPYEVLFKVSRGLFYDSDHPAVVDIHGVGYVSDEDETTVGEIDLILLRASQVLDGDSQPYELADQCDAHSQTAHDYHTAFYDSDTEFRSTVEDQIGPVIGSDLLILNTVQVCPDYRGRRFGLAMAYEAIELFGAGCGIVACKPFPLQYGDDSSAPGAGYPADPNSFETHRRRLTRYWKQLGFTKLRRSTYLAMNLSYMQPSRSELRIGADDV